MSRTITVHKLDHNGSEVWSYTGRLISEEAGRLLLEARYDLPEVRFERLTLRTGDRFVEFFYLDRWYNVFAVHDVEDDRFKGWYCNITRPAHVASGDDDLYFEDLALDLIVYPDRHWAVLDVEEFAALPLTLEERQRCLGALTELQSLAIRREDPFSRGSMAGTETA
jgi:protein associated with RNAse G/E